MQAALIARARLGASLDLEDEQPHPDRSSSGMPAVGRLDPDRQANLQRMLRGMHGSPSQAGSPEPSVLHKYAVEANHAEIATTTAHRSVVQISHAEAQTDADASTMALAMHVEVQVEVSECTAAVEACTARTPRHSMPTHLSDAAYQYEPDEDPEAVQGVHEWLHGDGGTDAGSPEAIHDPGVSPGNIEVPPPIPAYPLYPAVECLSASQQQCLIAPQHPLLPPLILKEHAASMHGQPPPQVSRDSLGQG